MFPGRVVVAFVAVTATVFTLSPGVVPVTLTVNEHPRLGRIVYPVKEMVFEPGTAVRVPPVQALGVPLKMGLRLLGVATTNPAGSVSVNEEPMSTTLAFGLVTPNERIAVPFNGIACGAKSLTMTGLKTTAAPFISLTAANRAASETSDIFVLDECDLDPDA